MLWVVRSSRLQQYVCVCAGRGSALYFLCLYAGLSYCSLLMTSSPPGSTHALTGLKPGASAECVCLCESECVFNLS